MNYYNEFDPKAAAWLRELIAAGHIPPGYVDTRSISDIAPHELQGYTQHHFFAGIGGWPLALRLAGWPDHRPVRTGSCPCQPFSSAGAQLAEKDPRHLWPVFRDLLAFLPPAIAFGEQVASALGRIWLAGIRADLEGLGYAVGAADLCSAGVGSPHIRQRLFWMANPHGRHAGAEGLQRSGQHGQRPEDDGAGRLEHPARDGRQQRRPEPDGRSVTGGCEPLRLGHPDRRRLFQHVQRHGHTAQIATDWDSRRPDAHGPSANFWDRFDVVLCTDGKARRIEPGSFPLAHGVSGRVGLLRGYGNAINPWLAAEFILASEEAL